MTDAEAAVIMRGHRASDLLANETFLWLINEQSAEHIAALIASPPGPSGLEKREFHHLQQHALTQLVMTLQGYIATGQAQATVLEEIGDEDEIEDLS